jgi:hypothetical protein
MLKSPYQPCIPTRGTKVPAGPRREEPEMTPHQKAELRAALREAFATAIDEIGVEAFKRTSRFGSNDPAFKSATIDLKQAA